MNSLNMVAGLLLGVAIGWWLAVFRAGRRQAADEARLHQAQTERERLERELTALKTTLTQSDEAGRTAEKQAATLEVELRNERRGAAEKLALLEQTGERMKTEFENLANRIFEEKGQRFSEQNSAKLKDVLEPLRGQLGDFRKRVDDVYGQEARERAGLRVQVEHLLKMNEQLSEEANQLTRALRGDVKRMGNWGELVVERVFEASGLQQGREYESQVHLHQRAGGVVSRYPDFVVHLPEGRDVIVDAKVTLPAYLRYCEAQDEQTRQEAVRDLVDAVRAHVRGLAAKHYTELEGLHTIDQVIMCVPSEAAFITAVQQDGSLYDEAIRGGVMLVGPSTLMLTLRIVSTMWRSADQQRHALDIAERGAALYDKFTNFVEDLQKISERLDQARSACEDASGKLSSGRGNLVRQAEMLRELGVKARKQLPRELVDRALADGEDTHGSTDE